jgi:hypothetical protein
MEVLLGLNLLDLKSICVGRNYHTYEWMTDRQVPLVTRVMNGAPLFDDSPMGLYDHLIDYLTTAVAAAPLVDLTLYFELALN